MRQIILFLFSILLVSCGNKIKFQEADINVQKATIKYKGEPYTGTIWSKDGQSTSIECINGMIKTIIAYHDNGAHAIVTTMSNGTRESRTYYDESGNEIDRGTFKEKYAQLREKIHKIEEEELTK